MPVLNEERHIEAAIRRVLDQDYPGELEVIIAVGPSSDRTREIAALHFRRWTRGSAWSTIQPRVRRQP